MTALLSLLIRHSLMLCAGFFAANGIDSSSSVGIITGLLMLACVTAWSLAEKWLDLKPGQLTDSTMIRTIIGALASQLVTAASAYFAVDANQPELLGVALINAGLSKAGVHQKLAALGSGKAALLLLLSVSSVGSVGCSNLTPSQRQQLTRTTLSLSQLGLSLAASRGVIKDGDKLLINDGLALLMQPDSTTRDKLMRLGALGLTAAVQRGLVKDGDVILIREATAVVEGVAPAPVTSGKAPVNVASGNDSSPPHSASLPACFMTYPSGHLPEAASSGQSCECGLLTHLLAGE